MEQEQEQYIERVLEINDKDYIHCYFCALNEQFPWFKIQIKQFSQLSQKDQLDLKKKIKETQAVDKRFNNITDEEYEQIQKQKKKRQDYIEEQQPEAFFKKFIKEFNRKQNIYEGNFTVDLFRKIKFKKRMITKGHDKKKEWGIYQKTFSTFFELSLLKIIEGFTKNDLTKSVQLQFCIVSLYFIRYSQQLTNLRQRQADLEKNKSQTSEQEKEQVEVEKTKIKEVLQTFSLLFDEIIVARYSILMIHTKNKKIWSLSDFTHNFVIKLLTNLRRIVQCILDQNINLEEEEMNIYVNLYICAFRQKQKEVVQELTDLQNQQNINNDNGQEEEEQKQEQINLQNDQEQILKLQNKQLKKYHDEHNQIQDEYIKYNIKLQKTTRLKRKDWNYSQDNFFSNKNQQKRDNQRSLSEETYQQCLPHPYQQ